MPNRERVFGGADVWAPLVSGRHLDAAAEFLDTHPGQIELAADHPLVPRLAFVLAQRGHSEEAMWLATSLRGVDLRQVDLADGAAVHHVADIVSARIWLSWLEQRTDEMALAMARRLISADSDLSVDPARRAALRFSVGAALMWGPGAGEPQVLEECVEHLSAARWQANLLGHTALEVAALARLALLGVPAGRVDEAHRFARSALAIGSVADETDVAPLATYGWFVASAVEQWARHFKGLPVDHEVMGDLNRELPRFAFDPVATSVAGTVVAFDHMRSARVQQARSMLNAVLADRRFAGLGVWRLRPLVTDAYLAIGSGDESRARERVADLTQAAAPGEALLIRATQLVATGENAAALTALGGVTAEQVQSYGLTLPVAHALEAMLFEQAGQSALADQSIRRALGAAEPDGLRRLFALHDPHVMMRLLRRAVVDRPGDRWAQDVLSFLEAGQRGGPQPAPLAVRSSSVAAAGFGAMSATQEVVDRSASVNNPSPLTERERQVLALVNVGASQAQMGRELYVSLNTVKTHLRSIRQKLGVERTGEAAAMARCAGWLEPV